MLFQPSKDSVMRLADAASSRRTAAFDSNTILVILFDLAEL